MKTGFEVRLPLHGGGYTAENIYSSRRYAQIIADGHNAALVTWALAETPDDDVAPHERMRFVESVQVADDFIFADYENA